MTNRRKTCVTCNEERHEQSFRIVRNGSVIDNDECAWCHYKHVEEARRAERLTKRRRRTK